MHLQGDVGRGEVLWLRGSLRGLFRSPPDAALIAQNYPPPYRLFTAHEAARALGIKTGECSIASIDWQSSQLGITCSDDLGNPDHPQPERAEGGVDSDILRSGGAASLKEVTEMNASGTRTKWRSTGRVFAEPMFTRHSGYPCSRPPLHAPSGTTTVTSSHSSPSNDLFWRKTA